MLFTQIEIELLLIQLNSTMGNQHMEGERFPYRNWEMISAGPKQVTLWRNRGNPQLHIEQTFIQTNDRNDFNSLRNLYFMRKNHPRLVSALYLNQKENDQFCTTSFRADVFLEKIPIRLFDLTNVPFPDVLHLYNQALLGYYQFSRKIGNFIVESEYMGINESGVLKVWAGATFPQISVTIGKIHQQDMVHSVIQCIEESINKSSMPKHNPSIRNFIYRTADKVNFLQAIEQFQTYVKMTNAGQVPDRLISLNDNSGLYIRSNDLLPSDRNNWAQPQNKQSMLIPQRVSREYIPQAQSQCISSQRYSNGMRSNSQQQITTFRKVESIANEPIYNRNDENKQINYQKPIRASRYYQADRYEGKVLPRTSSAQYFSPLDQNNIQYQQQGNQKFVHYTFYSPPAQSNHYILEQNYQNQQNTLQRQPVRTRSQRTIQQQQQQLQPNIYIYPPNPAAMQAYIHNQFTESKGIKSKQFINSIPVTQNPPARTSYNQNQIFHPSKNSQIDSKSIIMNEYSNNNQRNTFNFPRKIQHEALRQQQTGQFTSQTIINEDQPSYMHGVPKNQLQMKYIPLNNIQNTLQGNTASQLQSIEEVNTEHLSRNDEDSPSYSIPYNRNFRKVSHSHAPNNSYASYFNNSDQTLQQNRFNAKNINLASPAISHNLNTNHNYAAISNDDGKSSEQFLSKMKSINFSSMTSKQKFIELDGKKKSVSFTDTNQNIIYDYNNNPTIHKVKQSYQQSDPPDVAAIHYKQEQQRD